MSKGVSQLIEVLSLYTLVHALVHILPVVTVFLVSSQVMHGHSHSHTWSLVGDALFWTLVYHLFIPIFSVYAIRVRNPFLLESIV